MKTRFSGVLFVILLLFSLIPAAQAQISDAECFECHGDADADRPVDQIRFRQSVHAENECTSCHDDIEEAMHDTPLKKVVCADCHDIEAEIYLQSSHGMALRKGREQAATCKDCHGDSHYIISSKNPDSSINRNNISDTCARCHGDTEQMKQYNLNQLEPITSYENTVHGIAIERHDGTPAPVCTDCHGSHNLLKSTDRNSKLYWQNLPTTCGKCHENIAATYARSVHGEAVAEGIKDAPTCTDCHGEHSIASTASEASKVNAAHVATTCAECHDAERIVTKYRLPEFAVETYMQSYHGLSMRLGSLTAANCASCHGKHDILPSSDPRSSIHPDNLKKTCSVCHAGVTDQVARGQIHSGTRPGIEHVATGIVRKIYVWLFLIVLGGMLVHNGFDLVHKLREHLQKLKDAGMEHRMTVNERVQHAILAVTFIVLGYTGFALVNPDAWWARPFVGQVFDWRGYGHKLMAVIFVALSIFHIIYIIFTRRGRWQIKQLAPRWSDVVHACQMVGFYLGLRKERAKFEHYSYIEKAEYWALVWGSIVMVLTGTLMTYEEWTLAHFPKWFYDVCTAVHYYEAILACAAIVIWHFYFVMFDPEEYPVKWTFISGRESPADQHRNRPDEGHQTPEASRKE